MSREVFFLEVSKNYRALHERGCEALLQEGAVKAFSGYAADVPERIFIAALANNESALGYNQRIVAPLVKTAENLGIQLLVTGSSRQNFPLHKTLAQGVCEGATLSRLWADTARLGEDQDLKDLTDQILPLEWYDHTLLVSRDGTGPYESSILSGSNPLPPQVVLARPGLKRMIHLLGYTASMPRLMFHSTAARITGLPTKDAREAWQVWIETIQSIRDELVSEPLRMVYESLYIGPMLPFLKQQLP